MTAELAELLKQHGQRVDEFLEGVFPPDQKPYLSNSARYQLSSGGKRLRPALCLITCEALGGDSGGALPFAAATEILHNFFLVHDDIEDGDTMRRDKPTLWVKAGVPNAINVGDYLIAKAYRVILDAPLRPELNLKLASIFSMVFERTVEGQALDINLRGSPEVTLATYRQIVQLKTAYYLALPWVGGALVAGVSEEAEEALWELGRCLGPAFQIRDDVIDLTQGKGRGGEIGCDIKEGKPSIFFAHVLESTESGDPDRKRLVDIVTRPRDATTAEDVEWAIQLFRATGALQRAEAEADALIARSEEVIKALPLDGAGRDILHAISRFMVERTT